METWKDIQGYEGLYQVSDLGRIRSLGRITNAKNDSKSRKRERILTQEITAFGYCRVRLFNCEGKARHYAVHRIVAQHFIGNPEGFEVNHKNEIKTDNRADNLELVTSKENCNYGTRNERISDNHLHSQRISRRGVIQKDLNGRVIGRYSSRLEAERITGFKNQDIARCCNGKRKTHKGFIWENE